MPKIAAYQLPGGIVSIIDKVNDQTRSSNTTLSNDSDLVVSLLAGKTYRVKFWVFLFTANANMDFKYALNFSGTITSIYLKRKHITAGAAAGTDNENIGVQNTILGSTSVTATTTGVATVEIDLIITVNAAGVLGFQWAQNTTDAANLTVLKGSYLEYFEIS